MRRKLIVVSNRGPVTVTRDGSVRRSSGGLATALRSLLQHHDVTWIASATTDGERALAGETRQQDNYRLHLVAHDPQAYDWYYNVVANPMLWFIQHSLWELAYTPKVDAAFHRAWRDGYVVVNDGFARAVLAELEQEPGAAVFFHDYHLYLAPKLVRQSRPDATLMHFVHVPWPQPDYWSVLPRAARGAIHEGLIANDVIGFHTDRWRRNFIYSTRELLGEDVTQKTVTAPISVDPAEFDELARSEIFLPFVVPFVAGVLIWQTMLNPETGWIDVFLRTIGVAEPPDWLRDSSWVYAGLVFMGLWGIGGGIIIYLAGLANIPTDLYDAAKIDGAGYFAQLRNVTFPLLSPVVFFTLILGLVEVLQYFLVPLVLNAGTGEPGGSTLFLNLYIYKNFFGYHDLGYGSTIAWFLFGLTLLITLALFGSARRWVFYAGDR